MTRGGALGRENRGFTLRSAMRSQNDFVLAACDRALSSGAACANDAEGRARAGRASRALWPRRPGIALEADFTLRPQWSGIALEPCFTLRPQRSGIALEPCFTLRPRRSGIALEPCFTLPPGRSGIALEAGFALGARRSGIALEACFTLRPRRPGIALEAGFTLGTRRSDIALDANFTLRTRRAFPARGQGKRHDDCGRQQCDAHGDAPAPIAPRSRGSFASANAGAAHLQGARAAAAPPAGLQALPRPGLRCQASRRRRALRRSARARHWAITHCF